MTTVNDLKKDDILYGFCIGTKEFEIYQVINIDTKIHFDTIIGYPFKFYLMFPENVNLEEPILCKCQEAAWWIYTVNFDSIKGFIELDDWDWLRDQHLAFYFDEYLDIWSQTIKELK